MTGEWNVSFYGREAGRCSVIREGLYFRFRCSCKIPEHAICCLQAAVGEHFRKDLGVLVPEDGYFMLNKRVAAREFPPGEPVFTVTRRHEAMEKFVPLVPEEPFAYLHRLEKAWLERRNGVLGVVIPEP